MKQSIDNKAGQAKRTLLNGSWNLTFTHPESGEQIGTVAPVPGNVEPVLQKLGLIGDYMPTDHPHATTMFTAVDDWTYTTVFDAPTLADGWQRQLVFEGIDTIAEVWLNGEKLLDTMDMHMVYQADVSKKLRVRGNALRVVIRSSELWARKHPHDMLSASHGVTSYYDSQSFLRKARHQWGWDNAPRLLTSGIIGSVYLEDLPPCRFEEVYLYTQSVRENTVSIGVQFFFATDRKYLMDHRICFSLLDGKRVVFSEEKPLYFVQGTYTCKLDRSAVELWWPAGFGAAKLYTVRLKLLQKDECLAEYEAPFGIRTVKLERTGDINAKGEGEFQFYVNGEPIFIKGTNWKPLDPLASVAHRKTAEGRALAELTALNCNMVRIWGGGIYEDHPFFDYCDRHGILVWQDFMLACELPTRDRGYGDLVAAEAVQAVKKLRNHPSLAVWCGDNEDDECFSWIHRHSTLLPSHSRISREVLKEVILCHDPYRHYVESSPFVSDDMHRGEAGVLQTEKHLYAVPTAYAEALRNCKSRFLGETGPIKANPIAVNRTTFERERARAVRLWDSPKLPSDGTHQNDGYFTHWRQAGREACLQRFGRDFSFAEFDDYTLALNLVCAEVFKDVIEYGRATRPQKTGVLWWSLIDMWPMLFNYSVIDWEYNRKLPYYWIRQSQQDVLLMAVCTEKESAPTLYVANDTLQKADFSYTVTAYNDRCESREIACGEWSQAANSAAPILTLDRPAAPELWVIRWRMGEKQLVNHFFTAFAPFDVYARWTEIYARLCGFDGELSEIKT
ncbi:MAG: hypothetical protein IJX39_00055 [Clostridia bacterium]|nr:hypothetical protein [Clostridia bacterium]